MTRRNLFKSLLGLCGISVAAKVIVDPFEIHKQFLRRQRVLELKQRIYNRIAMGHAYSLKNGKIYKLLDDAWENPYLTKSQLEQLKKAFPNA